MIVIKKKHREKFNIQREIKAEDDNDSKGIVNHSGDLYQQFFVLSKC